jgi:hypothetical protein
MTTGSYEGFLPNEGIPDHHGVFRSREAFTGGLGGTAHPPTRVPRSKAKGTARTGSFREGERGVRMDERVATGMSEARPASASWEKNAHAHDERREATIMRVRAVCRSAEADRGRRETSSPLVMPYGAQDSVGRPRRASGESEPGTHEVWVTQSFGWQTSVGRIARLSQRQIARSDGAEGR